MNHEILATMVEKYGERAAASKFERSVYSRDLAPVPALLVDPLFKTLPDVVLRPADIAEVADIMKTAFAHKIPVTPRAGGSTVYFNSVPVRGGILLDLGLLRGVTALDKAGMTARVKTSTTWSELEEFLNGQGLACKSYPSSAPSATIGGWFCMMGYGIGSLKYGSLLSQVRSIEAVFPDGTVKTVTTAAQPGLDWFASSEGTLGVVCELELEVRTNQPMNHFLLQVPDGEQALAMIEALTAAPIRPYNLHFTDPSCVSALQALGFLPADIVASYLVGVDYEGPDSELESARKMVEALAGAKGGIALLPPAAAEHEWSERFNALKLKRGGPSVLGAEIWLPVKALPAYLGDVQKMSRAYALNLVSYGHLVTPEYATVMTTFYADETRVIKYIINLSLVKKIHDIGYKYGGYPYGVGLWNTPYIRRIHPAARLGELRQRKKSLDSRGIMNPGKVYRPPLLLNPFNFALAMNVLAGVRKVFGKGW